MANQATIEKEKLFIIIFFLPVPLLDADNFNLSLDFTFYQHRT